MPSEEEVGSAIRRALLKGLASDAANVARNVGVLSDDTLVKRVEDIVVEVRLAVDKELAAYRANQDEVVTYNPDDAEDA